MRLLSIILLITLVHLSLAWSKICDFCGIASTITCSNCTEAHYCGEKHRDLMKPYHEKLCGFPSKNSFRQPPLEMDEYMLFLEELEAYPDEEPKSAYLNNILKSSVSSEADNEPAVKWLSKYILLFAMLSDNGSISADKRNEWVGWIRQKIQFKISATEEEFKAFKKTHHRLLPFYQVADIELGILGFQEIRNPEFVRLYFLRSCLGEIETSDGEEVSFEDYYQLIGRMEKALKYWKEGQGSKAMKQYQSRLSLVRDHLKTRKINIGFLNEEQKMKAMWDRVRKSGVVPRDEM